nr:hypothetical protein [Tanacetum cinerariifolium]
MDLGGVGTVGPSVTRPLRVVMALSSPFGLATVLLGRDPDPEVEAVFIGFERIGNGRSFSNKSTVSSNGFKFTLRVGNGIAREISRP